MIYREIWKILGSFLFAFGLTLLFPFFIALYYEYIDPSPPITQNHPEAFFITFIICMLVAGVFRWLGGEAQGKELYRKESLVAVVLIWFLTPVIAALPFIFTETLERPMQAYFEAVSGLTTTGASVFSAKRYDEQTGREIPYTRLIRGDLDTLYIYYGTLEPIRDENGKIILEGIDAVGRPLLLWRSFLQWIGGLGIIVLFVAILPALGVGGKFLFHTEMPGPLKETMTPRLKETAAMLWKIYVVMSLVQVLLLHYSDAAFSWYDSFAVTFSTISTGGFAVHNGSIGYYESTTAEWIIIAFMLIGSINFSLYFYCLKGKIFRLNEPELLTYLIFILLAGTFVSFKLYGYERYPLTDAPVSYFGLAEAIRTGFFQVISAQTSTGFATTNFDLWPYVTQVLMLILIFIGGMSGSTAGGIKMMRHIMVFRIVQNKVELLFRPTTVRNFRIGNKQVSLDSALLVLCFFVTVLGLAVLSTFLLAYDGLDPQTALTTITSTINNSGMGFREAGPTDSYAFLSNFSLVVTSITMIMGRLEFFAVLVILVPAFWKKT
ncbi:MAG: TrkH family potassium uptake protein [Chlamydiales bacterium]